MVRNKEKPTYLTHGISFTDIHSPALNTVWPCAEAVGEMLVPMKLMDVLAPEVLGGTGAKVEVFILQISTF